MTKKIIALLLFVSTITLAQEKVLLRLNYEKGDSYVMDMKMSQNMGTVMSMNMNIEMKQDIKSVSNSEYTSEMKITKVVMNMIQQGMPMSYDSSKKAEDLDDTGKMMKSQMDPMLQAVITMKGNNLGKVLESKVEPNIPGTSDLANQSSNVVYPENAVAVGDTWNMSKNSKGMDFNFVYKVKSITSKTVLLDVTGKVKGMALGDIIGTMTVDKKSGVPTESKIDMTMKVQGQDLKTTMVLTMTKN
ncbi:MULTISPECIES: DUF6263 family protein [Tenacibaculum]|uniref:DUF6263 family protein n=1 Tax=Tenacibaculum TaxID=104267 RepID=UPI00089C724E|nr:MULTISPECIES: DUF6263 family protein [unclassified Tenacibaculum]RBW55819.1 hypothetical protein DS884_15830 [Tenacibaculum sp. E3R01]SEE63516.1 hypothetical protein SAMN04487765_3500 [Tenacibaculum sp. MAR_2010_89]